MSEKEFDHERENERHARAIHDRRIKAALKQIIDLAKVARTNAEKEILRIAKGALR